MKVIVLTFVTALVTSSASFAAGPYMPMTIATVVTAGGMPGPDGPQSRKIEISSDGEVSVSQNGGSYRLLLTLSRSSLELINKNQEALNIQGKLQPAAGSGPVCEDAATTTYSVRGHNGSLQTIGAVDGCRDMVPSDESQASDALVKILKSIDVM